ncbi:MAG: anti-sigma factor [Pseudomonadota bacterium]
MTNAPVTEAELQAYVDGRLPPEREIAVATWLAERPEEAMRVSFYRAQRDALRAATAPVAEEPLPPELDLLLRARPRPVWFGRAMIAAGMTTLFLAGGGTGWALRDWSTPPNAGTAALAREAAASYTVYANDSQRPVELAAGQQRELDGWFSQRLSRPVRAPDLRPAGLQLIGGRLVATDHGPAGLYLYRDAAGSRVALYVRPMQTEGTDRMKRRDAGNVRGWTWADNGLGFGVFGTFSGDRLHNTADMVRAQFRVT